jgi:VWFA-related protein
MVEVLTAPLESFEFSAQGIEEGSPAVRTGPLIASILSSLLLSSHAPAQQQKLYRFQVEVQNVYLDVFVERDGEAITDLKRENFIVLDNGVRQDFEIVESDAVSLSVMLVLDVSGSVMGKKLTHLRSAAHAFVHGLRERDEAGLLTFSHEVRVRKPLGSDFTLLHEALESTAGGGATALNDSLYIGLKLLEAAKGRPLLLLFTDGLDTASWLEESDVVKMARSSEAMIYAVGARATDGVVVGGRMIQGSAIETSRLLKRLTETSGGKVWFADSAAELKEIYLDILSEMGTRYVLTYQPQGVPEPGWHEIEVRLKGRKAGRVRARSGYMVTGN